MPRRPMLIAAACLMVATLCAPSAMQAEEPVSFELDVQPILTSRGCNAGACHGKQRGQNGFQLSLLGFDSDFDFDALRHNGRGRRVFPAAPDRSLMLLKATGQLPHGGGKVIDHGGDDYQTIRTWIASGMPRSIPDEPTLDRIEVKPSELTLTPTETADLTVTAFYSNGTTRDVTRRASYQPNEAAIADASDHGTITAGSLPGETAVMVRYMNLIEVAHVAIPQAEAVPAEFYAELPRQNFIDELVWRKLQTLGIKPSAPIDDAKYLRRVSIDIIGRLPTPDETRAFLANESETKRAELVDALLARPEYAEHWANKWADLLRPNPYRAGIKATLNYDTWIREQFRANVAYDQFVRELVTAQGSTWDNGAATLFRDRRSPDEVTTLVSQLFLGIRLECAKCHHHPFEKWGQKDFYSFAAYFARVGRKGQGVSPPISGGEESIFLADKGSVEHPLTGETLEPRPLFGTAPPVSSDSDPRHALAEWITSTENPYFAQVQVNRVWADLMGRGLVEPVDDLRSTNPPTNGPLLEALAEEFVQQRFDLTELLRTITASHVYALESLPNQYNVADTRNYSRHYRQRLRAEVVLTAVDDITGVPTDFSAMPERSLASQIWTHRIDSIFLDTFGRPNENEDPPCERLVESTVTQTLHLMNSPRLHTKLTSDKGKAAELAASDLSNDQLVEEIYLSVYNRLPDDNEREIARKRFGESDTSRRRATEDLLWALLNTPEFLFKD